MIETVWAGSMSRLPQVRSRCAGFALQEAVIILATLVSRFRFTRVPGRDPRPVLILTLRPEGGVWLDIEEAP